MKTLCAWVVVLLIGIGGCSKPESPGGDSPPPTASKKPSESASPDKSPPPSSPGAETSPKSPPADPAKSPETTNPTPSEAPFGRIEGKWAIRITPEMRDQMKASKVSGVELSLTFSAPSRFAMVAKSNEKGSQTVVGTAKVDGNQVLLTPTEIDGKAPTNPTDAQTLALTLDAAGKTLTSSDGRMIFERGQ